MSLASRKMKKNFIAVLDKGYPMEPYDDFPLWDLSYPNTHSLWGFILREMGELEEAVLKIWGGGLYEERYIENALDEIADVSNTLDYLYEYLLKARESRK